MTQNILALKSEHLVLFCVTFTLQVTMRPLPALVTILPDMSNTSALKTGAVPFSIVSSSFGVTRNSLGRPKKYQYHTVCIQT
jgi:hypothetical protein